MPSSRSTETDLCRASQYRRTWLDLRLLGDTGGGTTDMEGSQSQLSTRFTDRLGRDHTNRFADINHLRLARLRP